MASIITAIDNTAIDNTAIDNTAIDKIIFLLFTNAVTLFEVLLQKAKSPMIIPNVNAPIYSVTEKLRFPPFHPPSFIYSVEGWSKELLSH